MLAGKTTQSNRVKLLCDVMEHASEKSCWGREAPGTPKNTAEAQPEKAAWACQSRQGDGHVNQPFLLGGTSEKRR